MRTGTIGRDGSLVLALAAAALIALGPMAARADMVGHGGLIRSIAMSPDGRLTLTASFDYSARLWQFDEQSELRVLEGHDGPVNAAAFVPDSRIVATAGADGKVMLWDRDDGRLLRTLNGHRGRAMAIAISRDGRSALSGGWDGQLILWDIAGGAAPRRYETPVPITSVAFGPDENSLVAGGRDGGIRILRRRDGIALGRIAAHDIGLTQIVASADGRRLVSIGLDNHARVWNLDSFGLISEYLPDPLVKPVAAALSADGATMLVGYLDGHLLHLDAGTGRVRRKIKVEDGPLWALAFTPDSRFALTAGIEERVKVWHLQTGDRISVGDSDEPARPRPWLDSDHPGARLYRKCANCHALSLDERQRSGPHFAGLFGRRVGTVAGYRYSKALQSAEITWTRATLRELFRQGPDKYLPGTKMPVQRIGDERRLGELIEYLERIAPPR